MKDIKTAEEFVLQDDIPNLNGMMIHPLHLPIVYEVMKKYAEYYHKAKVEEMLTKNDRHILANFINHRSFDWDKQVFSVRIIKPLLEKLLNDL